MEQPKRKKIEIQEIPQDETRGAYRRTQTQAHRLSISVSTARGEEFTGVFHDLSIGGASAKFIITENALVNGQIVLLTIGCLTRTAKVIAKARVMFSVDSPGGRHCGFQFTEPQVLAKQIDSFYGRFFNRRRAPRVTMPLDKKIAVTLSHDGSDIKCVISNLSADGMELRTTRDQAKEFDGKNHAFFRFTLPGQQEEIHGRAAILRRKQDRGIVTMGLAFDLLQQDGVSKHIAALNSWIVHRSNEISRWDSSLTKMDTTFTMPDGSLKKRHQGESKPGNAA